MTINHIDQLTQWWKAAEEGSPSPGDTIITNRDGGGYLIETASGYWSGREQYGHTRILARAPKPKPAWHDAVAVMARFPNMAEGYRELMTRDEVHTDTWHSDHGYGYTEDLRDVTPLIEAKVTDEMVDRARDYMSINTGQTHTHNAIRGVITTALGLDPA